MDNLTTQFLGNEYQWSAAKILWDDVQSLTGGIRLKIGGSGRVEITVVEPKKQNHRYWFYLNDKELKALFNQFITQDFVAIKLEEKAAIADDARPQITLINHRGERHSVTKWTGVVDKRLEKLERTLNNIATPQDYWLYIEPEEPRWQAIAKALSLLVLIIAAPVVTGKLLYHFIDLKQGQEPETFIPLILAGSCIVLLLLGISLLCEWLTVRHTDFFSRPASILIVLLCAVSLIGLLFVPPVIIQTSFSYWGTPTAAEINDKFVHYSYNSESGIVETDYYLKYRYQTVSDEYFNGQALVKRRYYDQTNPGDRLTAYYLPMVPRWSVLEAQRNALSRIPFVLKILCTLIAWSLELLIITYIVYPLWQRFKPKPKPLPLPRRS